MSTRVDEMTNRVGGIDERLNDVAAKTDANTKAINTLTVKTE